MSLSIKYWLKNCAGYINLLRNTDDYPAPYTRIITPTILGLVSQYTKKTDHLIDLGCGEGYLTRKIKSIRPNIIGVDLSPEMISSATSQAGDIEYSLCNLETPSANLPANYYSFAFSTLVFMYLEKIDVALANIFCTLKPGGYLVISITHPCFYHQENFSWFQEEDSSPYHIGDYLREKTTIRNIAKKFMTHHIHRTIGNYIRTFHKNGFNLIDVLEPKPDITVTKVLKKVSKVPIYAIFVLQKPR